MNLREDLLDDSYFLSLEPAEKWTADSTRTSSQIRWKKSSGTSRSVVLRKLSASEPSTTMSHCLPRNELHFQLIPESLRLERRREPSA